MAAMQALPPACARSCAARSRRAGCTASASPRSAPAGAPPPPPGFQRSAGGLLRLGAAPGAAVRPRPRRVAAAAEPEVRWHTPGHAAPGRPRRARARMAPARPRAAAHTPHPAQPRARAWPQGAEVAEEGGAKSGLQRDNPELAERFAVIGSGSAECKSCQYVYEPKLGDDTYPVARGTAFKARRRPRRRSHACGVAPRRARAPRRAPRRRDATPQGAHSRRGRASADASARPLAPGVASRLATRALQDLPADWRCPTCGAEKKLFVSKAKVVAGFSQNQGAPPACARAPRRPQAQQERHSASE
jgi:rubredoxin